MRARVLVREHHVEDMERRDARWRALVDAAKIPPLD
jgi:hypothetical protein